MAPGPPAVSPARKAHDGHPRGTRFPHHVGQATILWRAEVPAAAGKRRRPAQYRLLWTDADGERQETTSSSWTTILGRAREISADLDHPGSDSYVDTHTSRGGKRDLSLYKNHIRPCIENKAVRDVRPRLVLSIIQSVVDAAYASDTCYAVRAIMNKVAG